MPGRLPVEASHVDVASVVDAKAVLAGIPAILNQRVAAFGSKTFIKFLDDGTDLMYGELELGANQLAAGLLATGLGIGEKVGLFLPTGREFILYWFACLAAGLVDVPVNPELKDTVLQFALEAADITVVVTDQAGLFELQNMPPQTMKRLKYIVTDKYQDLRHEPSLTPVYATADILSWPNQPIVRPLGPADATSLASIRFTSGTSGPPKGVMFSQAHMLSKAAAWGWLMGFNAEDVLYSCFPLHHSLASNSGVLAALWAGGTIALTGRFSARRYWSDIRLSGATLAQILDPLVPILQSAAPTAADRDHKVRNMYTTSRDHPEFEERFGVELVRIFASSEISIAACNRPGYERRSGSCGKESPLFEVKIVDSDDCPVAIDIEGEIVVRPRTPNTMFLGYYNNDAATVRRWRNLWYHTNDRGRIDADGFLYFLGRDADAIRRRGVNISAEQIEEAIREHTAVSECAVVGVPSELGENDIKACVVPLENATLQPTELVAYLFNHLPRHLVPRYVEIRTHLPKTETGKVRKVELRSEGRQGLTAQTWDSDKGTYWNELDTQVGAGRAAPQSDQEPK